MPEHRIARIAAREILDSKARPMVEVDVWTTDGASGRGASPCGTSVGRHEAFVLRDGGPRYRGMGVLRAVQNVREIIFPAIEPMSVLDQRAVDERLIALDGTPDKSRLGANAIYSVSIAVARAAAHARELPLYRALGEPDVNGLPVPMFNMVNGGSATRMAFQEFLLIPAAAERYSEALRAGVEIYAVLEEILAKRFGADGVQTGSSAGYRAPSSDPAEILDTLLEAAEAAGYGGRVRLGLDCAASHFYNARAGSYQLQGRPVGRDEMIETVQKLAAAYGLFVVEDPLHEDDFEGHAELTRRLQTIVIGDDLFVTNLERLKIGIGLGAGNAMLLKPNMVGTITEAMDAARYAQAHGYQVVGSGRAGGSIDDPIPDIAVAVGAPLVKFGAPRTGERLSKQNALLRMEEALGPSGRYAGADMFASARGPC
jgi:enolase 1/2/3